MRGLMADPAKSKMPKPKWVIAMSLLGVLTGLLVPHNTRARLPNGGTLKIHTGSFLASLLESASRIEIQPVSGRTVHVELLNSSPLVVIPSTNHNIFFCVCYQDPYLVLIRININEPFQKIPRESPIRDTVAGANCKIERVLYRQAEDWTLVASQLKNMPSSMYKRQSAPGLSWFGFPVLYNSQRVLAASMRNRGDVGEFEDDFL